MNIPCPQCGVIYDVPEERLPAGRGLRCSACSHTWRHTAADWPDPPLADDALSSGQVEAAAGDLPVSDSPRPDIARLSPQPPHRQTASMALIAAWLLSASIMTAGIGAIYAHGSGIAMAWPPAGRLFAQAVPPGQLRMERQDPPGAGQPKHDLLHEGHGAAE